MVNEYGAQYWAYFFENDLPQEDRYIHHRFLETLIIYAFSEEEAREKFERKFYRPAGKLEDRQPW